MPEFLGYVNPANVKANPTLDWGSVITDVQDTIVSQEQQRQATRDKMAKENADLNKELNNISLSRSQDINGFLTNSVYKAKEINNEAYKLYTSGKINGKQFNIIKSNIKNGFDEFNTLGKSIAKIQEDYAALSEQGKTSFLADYNMGQLGNALDLKNKIPYVDPATGLMYVAPMDEKGMPDMSKLDSPKWMLAQADMPLKFDYLAETEKRMKDLGKYEQVMSKPPAGGIWTTDNIKSMPEFAKFLEETAAAIASNPIKQASILGDRSGSGYTLTSDPKSTDKNSIVVKKDLSTGMNTPVLTEEQIKEAKDIVKNALLVKVNQTLRQDENTYRPPTGGSRGGGSDKDVNKPEKNQFASAIEYPGNGKGGFVPMSGVNIKVGAKTENLPFWGMDDNGKLFVDVVTYIEDPDDEYGSKIESKKRYSENNVEFKKRVRYLINPNTGTRISNTSEAKSLFRSSSGAGNNTSSNKTMTQSDFNSKWSKLKSGQSLVGPDGQTYIKK